MEGNKSGYVELLKYPVLVLSILLALIAMKFTLGLEFGMLTEFSTSGLKFSEKSNQATLEAITELEARIEDLSARLESVEAGDEAAPALSGTEKSKAFSKTQSVSDATANIARLTAAASDDAIPRLTGWMWIGDFNGKWSKTSLVNLGTGQPITITPSEMQAGTEYRVLGNMVVREGLPPNNAEYYRAQKSLGVVPRGSIVRILKQPVGVNREFAVQYWVQIEHEREPVMLK